VTNELIGLISESEIDIYELHDLTEAEKWRLVADKWRKSALIAERNNEYYQRQLAVRP
jgi:hypothetical protein